MPTLYTRREALARIAGAVALSGQKLTGHQAASPPPHRIDIHQHFVSPKLHETLTAKNAPILGAWRNFSPSGVISAMDRTGIATAMLSVTTPGIWFGDVEETRNLARDLNEFAAAKMLGDYKRRFGLFAALPLPNVENSLQELAYALDVLKADGVGMLTSYDDKWLGDPAFAPVLEELNRRKAIVYVHPVDAACCVGNIPDVTPQMLEYPTNTTRPIASLLVTGAASRYSQVRFVFAHAGGTITSLAGRFVGRGASADVFSKPAEPDSGLFHLRRFYYDTALVANPVNMQELKTLVPTSQILFGTDAPFGSTTATVEALMHCGFSPDDLRAVERENAARLLPKYA
jgi:predicted TIM-barrel fold metal-dependent hydrolase